MKKRFWGLAVACGVGAVPAWADFHIMSITEVMTGANGDPSIQFIELRMDDAGQNFVDGHTIVARNADGSVSRTVFTFPAGANTSLVGESGRRILIGSTAFAAVSGVTPDFVFDPADSGGGLFQGSGQVDFASGSATVSYGSYTGPGAIGSPAPAVPGDDLRSLQRTGTTFNDAADFVLADNTPTNNAGVTGHVGTASSEKPPLRITEVNPATGEVEVTNISTSAYTTPAAFPFSHGSNTDSSIPSGTGFAPGESRLFTVSGLSATDSDLWLYSDTSFSSPSSIIAGLKYGPAPGVGRTPVAVAAGIWTSTSAFVAAPAGGLALLAIGTDFTGPDNWASGTPNPGAWFGTGTPIADPLPPVPKGNLTIELQTVATGLAAPLGVTEPDDGSGRLLIYDQGGTVTLVLNGVKQPTPFLDVSDRLVPLGLFPPLNYDERGLLGLACHPNFAANPKIYTYTTEPAGSGVADFTTTEPVSGFDHQNVVAEWTVSATDPNVIDPASRREILRIDHPAFNHDGGTLRFGPDGMLYISIGDGGEGDDQGAGHHEEDGNAQQLDSVYGKILRIDVDGSDSANGRYGIPPDNPFVGKPGLDEIWAYGLRNPYAFSFDQVSGDLYVGDAGQNRIEEIDIVTTGANCGWRLMEGTFFFDPNGASAGFVTAIPFKPVPDDVLDPVAQYDHDDGSVVIGGFVYRAADIPELTGLYVTGDFGRFNSPTGRLFYLDGTEGLKEFQIGPSDEPFGRWLKGFGQDRQGNVYICASSMLGPFGDTGVVFRIVRQTASADWELYE